MLTQDEIAYGQQKNREFIWQQARQERMEYKISLAKDFGYEVEPWNELDENMAYIRYELLANASNITPW